MPNKKVIFIRTKEEKYDQVTEEAEKESRSRGNFLMWLFDMYMERRKK